MIGVYADSTLGMSKWRTSTITQKLPAHLVSLEPDLGDNILFCDLLFDFIGQSGVRYFLLGRKLQFKTDSLQNSNDRDDAIKSSLAVI